MENSRIIFVAQVFERSTFFRGIRSGNLNAQFEIRSTTILQSEKGMEKKRIKTKNGTTREIGTKVDDANHQIVIIESTTYAYISFKYMHNSRIIVSMLVAYPGQTHSQRVCRNFVIRRWISHVDTRNFIVAWTKLLRLRSLALTLINNRMLSELSAPWQRIRRRV